MNGSDIIFKNLGIEFKSIESIAFEVFGIPIYWYALFICIGFIGGLLIPMAIAKRTNQSTEIYVDFFLYCLIAAIVGARLYYVAFEWDSYKDDLMKIFYIREGGLAIYGGVIACVITLYVFAKIKKLNFWVMCDTAAPGLVFGQMIGRFGNFMNFEAFGGYTDNLFAMSMKVSKAKYIPAELMDKIVSIEGIDYIQVHPTFLYESLWSLALIIGLLVYFKHRKFDGEIFLLYLFGYGLGRSWIEGLRTDQLIIGSTGIPASQLLAIILVVVSIIGIVVNRRRLKHS
jgi:phosphatidylglycerol:prolipoprotein diacylglycerol transferase